jgi:L-2-hydroxyglutarate oxidase LhgO
MTADFDTIIIGAGVVGLAIARQLSQGGQSVLVIDAAARAGTETSSRNSEVVHAGIYYPKGSLKAELCIEGRQLLFGFCNSHGVDIKRTGKLIVATSPEEEMKLASIISLAAQNGVDDLVWMTERQVAELEPEVCCTKALFSPSTGIVDASSYMLALQGDAEAQGALFAFNTSFLRSQNRDGCFIVETVDAQDEVAEISCRRLINCAGHGAHDVVAHVEGYSIDRAPPRYLAKGSYCSVSGKSPFRHLIYPVPVSGALGIHATLDMAGAVRFGPDIQWIDEFDYSLSPDITDKFVAAVKSYWPGVEGRRLTPSYCGIRPKIHGPQQSFADFKIEAKPEHGISGLINLFGIESPGLTASLAIAKSVAQIIGE